MHITYALPSLGDCYPESHRSIIGIDIE